MRRILIAVVVGILPAMALADGVPQPPPPDPALVAAGLRQELGKAIFEGGQIQAQLAHANAALAKAQARITELEKETKPAAEAKPGEAPPPTAGNPRKGPRGPSQ